jgi:hypothetical protein
MNVEEIKIAFSKNIELNSDTTIPAYIQLPAGVWTIGDKKYTVSEFTQNPGTGNEYMTTVIDLIEPATSETATAPETPVV